MITYAVISWILLVHSTADSHHDYRILIADEDIAVFVRFYGLSGLVEFSTTEYFDEKVISFAWTDFEEIQPNRTEESPPLSGHGLANTSQITWQSVPQTSLYPSSEVKCYWEKLTAKLYDHSSRTARIIGNIEVDLFVFRESGEVIVRDSSTMANVMKADIWMEVKLDMFDFCKEGVRRFLTDCANLTSTGLIFGTILSGPEDPAPSWNVTNDWVDIGGGALAWFNNQGIYDGEVRDCDVSIEELPGGKARVELEMSRFEQFMRTRFAFVIHDARIEASQMNTAVSSESAIIIITGLPVLLAMVAAN